MSNLLNLNLLRPQILKKAPHGGAVRVYHLGDTDSLDFVVNPVGKEPKYGYGLGEFKLSFTDKKEFFKNHFPVTSPEGRDWIASAVKINLLRRSVHTEIDIFVDKVHLAEHFQTTHTLFIKDLPLGPHTIGLTFGDKETHSLIAENAQGSMSLDSVHIRWQFYSPDFPDIPNDLLLERRLVSEYYLTAENVKENE